MKPPCVHSSHVLPWPYLLCGSAFAAQSRYLEPYGTAKKDMHPYPTINRVYDVNYYKPQELNALYNFIVNVNRVVPGKPSWFCTGRRFGRSPRRIT